MIENSSIANWDIEVSQNGWEYTGHVYIKAKSVVRFGEKGVFADGVEITFDEEIGEIIKR